MAAQEGKKYIGLSLSACVYDIVKGVIKEDQVERIIAGTAVSGFEREIDQRIDRDIKFGAGLFPSDDQIMAELLERKHNIYSNPWDVVDTIRDRKVSNIRILTENNYGSWEYMFENESMWKNKEEGFKEKCIEVATRLIQEGKVQQPRLMGEACPNHAVSRWVDADTGEFINIHEEEVSTGTYLLEILQRRGVLEGVPVVKRDSWAR